MTDSNAGQLAGGAYRSGDAGTSVSAPIAGVATASEPASARSVRIATMAHNALSKIDMHSGGVVQATGATAQDSLPGPCGGSASYSISYDESTGSFSGNFSFNGYCEAGETISGSMVFSGLLDIATEQFISFQIDVNNLSISNGSDSFAIAGTISFSFSGTNEMTVTETFNIGDGSGKVYRVENFVVTIDSVMNTVDLAGRFYHPDHGYVVVATPVVLEIDPVTGIPENGTMTITGVDGGARLMATGDGNYTLDLDDDGDGIYETALPGGTWSDL